VKEAITFQKQVNAVLTSYQEALAQCGLVENMKETAKMQQKRDKLPAINQKFASFMEAVAELGSIYSSVRNSTSKPPHSHVSNITPSRKQVIEAEIDLTHEKRIAAFHQEALEQSQELESRIGTAGRVNKSSDCIKGETS